MAETRVVKLCVQVCCLKSTPMLDKPPQKGRGYCRVIHFNFGAQWYLQNSWSQSWNFEYR